MSNAVKRALRTFLQAFIGTILASGVFALVASGEQVPVDAFLVAARSAGAAGLIAVLSWAQNALEDADKLKAILKD